MLPQPPRPGSIRAYSGSTVMQDAFSSYILFAVCVRLARVLSTSRIGCGSGVPRIIRRNSCVSPAFRVSAVAILPSLQEKRESGYGNRPCDLFWHLAFLVPAVCVTPRGVLYYLPSKACETVRDFLPRLAFSFGKIKKKRYSNVRWDSDVRRNSNVRRNSDVKEIRTLPRPGAAGIGRRTSCWQRA